MTPSGLCFLDFLTILVWISRWKFWISWWQCYWVGDTNVTPPCSGVDDGPTSWAKEALISDIAICQARFRPNFPLLIFSNWRHFFRVNLNHQRYRTLYLLFRVWHLKIIMPLVSPSNFHQNLFNTKIRPPQIFPGFNTFLFYQFSFLFQLSCPSLLVICPIIWKGSIRMGSQIKWRINHSSRMHFFF